MNGSGEGRKMGIFDSKVLGTILGNVHIITLGIDIGTELGSLYGAFDGSNYCKVEVLLIGYTLGSDEGIKLVLSDGNTLELYLEMYI